VHLAVRHRCRPALLTAPRPRSTSEARVRGQFALHGVVAQVSSDALPPGGCSNRALRHRLHEPRHHDQLHELLTACVLNPRRSLRARTARQPRFDSFLCWVHDPARVGMVSPFPAQLYLLCPRYTVGAFFERWVRTGTAMPSRGKAPAHSPRAAPPCPLCRLFRNANRSHSGSAN